MRPDQRNRQPTGEHRAPERGGGAHLRARKVEDIRAQFPGSLDPGSEVWRLIRVERAQVRGIDDRPAIVDKSLGEGASEALTEAGLIVDHEGTPFPQPAEGEVGARRSLDQLRRDHPKKAIELPRPQAGGQAVAVPVGGLLGQALVRDRGADDGEDGGVRYRQLTLRQAVVQWADQGDDAGIAGQPLDVVRAGDGIVDSPGHVIRSHRLELETRVLV